jgi:uncharacterized surface protein with fasciclin (FAS1) repeats
MEILQSLKIKRLPELIIQTGLKKSLEQAKNISLLVPRDEAFKVTYKYALNSNVVYMDR